MSLFFVSVRVNSILKYLLLVCFLPLLSQAQTQISISGNIRDRESGKPVEGASVSLVGTSVATLSDEKGHYELKVPASGKIKLRVVLFTYLPAEKSFDTAEGESIFWDVILLPNVRELGGVMIEDAATRNTTLMRLNPRLAATLPTTGGIESLLKTMPGVSSNNELSSQYNVRGGNFDENLVYVNDIEIYRPFLVRSGQQEGLSFINPDMVSSVLFSAGGFDAKYGDKMSSVLDIRYRKPREFNGTISASLLGASLHLEGKSRDSRFTWLTGFRQRSNRYILSALDTKADYRPLFIDGQTLLHYDFTPEFSMEFLANYSRNRYLMVPENRQTQFGTVNEALRFTVYFDGKENTDFETMLGALSATHQPNPKLSLRYILSAYRSYEFETYDVQGQYYIDQLETDLSKPSFGDVKFNRGVGTFLNHARNYLTATVANAEHKGQYKNLFWGMRIQAEQMDDQLKEWQMIDSAGYSLPQSNPYALEIQSYNKQNILLRSLRISDYIQRDFSWGDTTKWNLHAGLRTNYWTLNKQLLISPRATLSVKPDWKYDWVFRLSSGIYYQPPFYRELRNLKGEINRDLKAQQSIHFVLGGDHNLKIWNRPFKITTELYYKQLDNLVPYEIDNVRIRYYATNNSRGYATGIDTRIYGEFVNGVESWFSLSVMKTSENITDDFFFRYLNSDSEIIRPGITTNNIVTDSVRVEPGFVPRPTDQRVNIGVFFQDYIPRLPDCKMSLNLLYGSGMPFGPPSYNRFADTLKMPSYRRVDLGLSYEIIKENRDKKQHNFWNNVRSLWLGVEVFNLLQVNNTISYLWVKDISNRQYAIPNFLTNRQVNVKLITRF